MHACIGSLIAIPACAHLNIKFVIVLGLIGQGSSLLLFTLSNNFWILAASRLMTGMCQVFFAIYFPVWVDIFGDEETQTIWLANLLLGVPLGVILGYIFTAFMISYAHVSTFSIAFCYQNS